jgi:hypothetical protein
VLSLPFLSLALAGLAAPTAHAGGGRHPYFDDRGTLTWYESLRDAEASASAEGKAIFVEYGRRRCPSCKVLCSEVIPDATVRTRLSKVAVGLATDCDDPEPAVEEMLRRHLPSAEELPFAGFMRSDGRWICGFSGAIAPSQFLEHVAAVERIVAADRAADRTRAQGDASTLLSRAQAAAQKGAWCDVVKYCREAGPSDRAMQALKQRARAWAESRLVVATSYLRARRYDDAATECSTVARAMAGEPEAEDAAKGTRTAGALRTLDTIGRDSASAASILSRAKEDVRGSRWEALLS